MAQRGEPGAHVVDRQPQTGRPQRIEGGRQRRVVLDRVVLRQLQQHPVHREQPQQGRTGRVEQHGRRDVQGDVPLDGVQVTGRPLECLQLEASALAHPVRLREADVGRHPPLGGEPAERLGAHADAVREPDDRLEHHHRPSGRDQRVEAAPDLGLRLALAHHRFEHERRGPGEHLHEAVLAAAEGGVGAQPRGAEGAVQAAVRQAHGNGDVAAEPGQTRRGQRHRDRVTREVGQHRRDPSVERRLAQAGRLRPGGTLAHEDRDRGLDDLERLGGPVEAAEERHRQAQRRPGSAEQVRDLLVDVAARPCHEAPVGTRGRFLRPLRPPTWWASRSGRPGCRRAAVRAATRARTVPAARRSGPRTAGGTTGGTPAPPAASRG